MSRTPIGTSAMTNAERQKRWRDKHGKKLSVTKSPLAGYHDFQMAVLDLAAQMINQGRNRGRVADALERLAMAIRDA